MESIDTILTLVFLICNAMQILQVIFPKQKKVGKNVFPQCHLGFHGHISCKGIFLAVILPTSNKPLF